MPTVLGFARWLERGAKPEFLGITQLPATAADIAERRRHLASDERLYTGGTLGTVGTMNRRGTMSAVTFAEAGAAAGVPFTVTITLASLTSGVRG
jgi:hypothetical protein